MSTSGFIVEKPEPEVPKKCSKMLDWGVTTWYYRLKRICKTSLYFLHTKSSDLSTNCVEWSERPRSSNLSINCLERYETLRSNHWSTNCFERSEKPRSSNSSTNCLERSERLRSSYWSTNYLERSERPYSSEARAQQAMIVPLNGQITAFSREAIYRQITASWPLAPLWAIGWPKTAS